MEEETNNEVREKKNQKKPQPNKQRKGGVSV